MRIVALAGMIAITTASIVAQGKPDRPATAAPPAGSAAAAIREVADAYVKATTSGDAKAVAALYTEDAVEMPPNLPPVKGRAAIQQYYDKVFSSGFKVTTFTLKHLETHATGDNGYDVGTYEQGLAEPSASTPVSDTGKYVVIVRRTAAGWKVAYAIYNSDQAPRPAR
jgi:uncharacterized protein (TIGR02246 family)